MYKKFTVESILHLTTICPFSGLAPGGSAVTAFQSIGTGVQVSVPCPLLVTEAVHKPLFSGKNFKHRAAALFRWTWKPRPLLVVTLSPAAQEHFTPEQDTQVMVALSTRKA